MSNHKRSQSDWDSPIVSPNNDIPSELPPAIPAMLTKAKEVIKRKLKETGTEQQPRIQSLPSELKERDEVQQDNQEKIHENEETFNVQIACPLEVEELKKSTERIRLVLI